MTVNSKIRLLILTLLMLSFIEQCKPKSDSQQTGISSVTHSRTTTTFDTIIRQLKTRSELTRIDILTLDVIDTTYSKTSGETAYCDTTVQLSDSIFYSIIYISDDGGNCSHYFIVTINENNKKAITSKYLRPDCDIDFSRSSYDLFDYKILSKDTIELTQTTVFQKKNKSSDDEEENIDHKQTEKSFFIVQPGGHIKTLKDNSQ